MSEIANTPASSPASSPAQPDERLFVDFQPPSYEEWVEATVKSLRGKPFESLISHTYEGFEIQPIYRQEDAAGIDHQHTLPGASPFARGPKASGYLIQPWGVAQEIGYRSPRETNAALRHDLDRGQTVVNLALAEATLAGRDSLAADEAGAGGLALRDADDLAQALDGVDLAAFPIIVDGGTAALALTGLLAAVAERQGVSLARLQGWIDNDPLAALAQDGSLPAPLETHLDEMAWLTGWAAEHAPGFGTVAVHGDCYQNSGGHAVQELTFALATGVAYIRAMAERGLDIEITAPRMRFVLGVGPDFFMEMAKLRAARLLWSQVVDAFGGGEDAQRMRIHARTASWNKAAADPYVNLLRTTTEAFAGALGGVESLHVTPFDAPLRPPDEFSHRLARNQQLILQAEANLIRLIDPAGGAWYVEWLTDQVARRAWALFQEVEARGGMAAALMEGFPQAQVAATAQARAENVAAGKDVFVGVNKYPPPANGITPSLHAMADQAPPSPGRSDRIAVDDDRRQALLDRLVQARKAGGATVVQAAVDAAAGGVTLVEITGALRADAGDGPTVTRLVSFHIEEARS